MSESCVGKIGNRLCFYCSARQIVPQALFIGGRETVVLPKLTSELVTLIRTKVNEDEFEQGRRLCVR